MTNDPQKQLFRKESLDRLSSPEALDQLIQIVAPRDWLPLLTLAILVLVGVGWSIWGQIPTTVSGRGVVIRPRRIVEIQSPIAGQLEELKVEVGDCVAKGPEVTPSPSVIALVNPTDLKQQLQLQREKLQQLQNQNRTAAELELERLQLEKSSREQQRRTLQQRLQQVETLNPRLREQNRVALQQQKLSVEQRLKDAEATVPVLQQRLERRRSLYQAGALDQDTFLQAEQEYRQSLQVVAELKAQLKQLDVEATRVQQEYLEAYTALSQLETQLRDLAAQEKSLQQEVLTAATARKDQLLEVQQQIQRLEQQIVRNSMIRSPYPGCILELAVVPGQILSPGMRLGTLQVNTASDTLKAISYFPVSEGKRIKPGMIIQVTPSTVKRERFGGILGKVTAVSSFPVSKAAAISLLGSTELAGDLLGSAPQIEVQSVLQTNAQGVYQWSSSRGPKDFSLSSGTTTTDQVIVEQQAPITFVLPILRQWTGLN
uniref:Secretion protein HlyD family protein n=1 Tax=Cyanothece sp. (strain PCC 7425 / ATCC 29141) TaxID=395961 RepID=B8HRD5_CYAP4